MTTWDARDEKILCEVPVQLVSAHHKDKPRVLIKLYICHKYLRQFHIRKSCSSNYKTRLSAAIKNLNYILHVNTYFSKIFHVVTYVNI
jgi:hypothetical protein